MKPKRAPVAGFLSGTFISQISSEALHLAQPLLIMRLSGSLGSAAFFSSFTTAVHMGGTLVGGWPADRFGSRRLLIASALLRAATLAAIPLLWICGHLTLGWAMAAYIADSFVRGFVDTSSHALPLEVAGRESGELDRLNSLYELMFDLGSVIGPALLGLLMLSDKDFAVHALIPAGFVAASLAFKAIPGARAAVASVPAADAGPRAGGTLEGVRVMWADRGLAAACAGLALMNLYPLRRLISAYFAKSILGHPPAAGWVGAAFGLGGVAGAILYRRLGTQVPSSRWVAAGALGVIALAVGWTPATLAAMLAAVFGFAATNSCARLAMTRALQERMPLENAGGVMAVVRFGSNASSVLLKAALGMAFAMGGGPRAAFGALGVGLVALAAAQWILSARLRLEPEVGALPSQAVG